MMDTIFWPLTPLKSVNLFGGLYKDRRYIKGHITFVSICKKNASQNKFLEIMAESIIFTVVWQVEFKKQTCRLFVKKKNTDLYKFTT